MEGHPLRLISELHTRGHCSVAQGLEHKFIALQMELCASITQLNLLQGIHRVANGKPGNWFSICKRLR